MITGLDIICISSIEWDFLWQGHQEIASRLAQAGNRVLYVENTGIRSPGIKDAGRVVARLKNWVRSLLSGGLREVHPNIFVCSPIVLPPFGSRARRYFNRRFLLPQVRRVARRLGLRDVLIWTYLPTDTTLDLLEMLRTPRSLVVYYCIADFAHLTPQVQRMKESEKSLIQKSDLIFAQGPELAAHCGQWNEQVHIFPFGVDLEKFPPDDGGNGHQPPRHRSSPAADGAASLQTLAHPMIGYIGGLHLHVDYGLLIEMAHARKDWSWVFVGPTQTSVAALEELPNVYLLGQKPHHNLVHYIRQFDVCIVPYVNSLYTATVVPTKINEYLAVGKPVVSTMLPAVCEFNKEHHVLQTAPTEPGKFLHAIDRALHEPSDQTAIRRRRAVAALGDWDTRVFAMSALIANALKQKEGV
jgi:glycosyltransferase involved in cell wall biosynthesis